MEKGHKAWGCFYPVSCLILLLTRNLTGGVCRCLTRWLTRKALITFPYRWGRRQEEGEEGSCIADKGRQQAGSGVLPAQGSSRTQVSWQSAVTPTMLPPHVPLHCSASSRWCSFTTSLSSGLTLCPSPSYPTWHGSNLPSSMNSSLSPSIHNLLEITLTIETAVENLISLLHWNFMIRFTYVSSSKTISSCRAETMPSAFL